MNKPLNTLLRTPLNTPLSITTLVCLCLLAVAARAQEPSDLASALLQQSAHALAGSLNAEGPTPRIEVQLGAPDARLRLAPCQRTEAYLPAGHRAIGRTRVGLRCLQGTTLWNITLPAQVKVWANGLVAMAPLPAGTRLAAHHLHLALIDWGADGGAAFASPTPVLGRELARPLAAGAAVRSDDLKQRQWFSAGETVQLVARGSGFAVSGEGEALSHGIEGQPARVRTPSGRILSGRPSGDRVVEVSL